MRRKIEGRLNLRKIILLCRQHFILLIIFGLFAGGIGFAIARFAIIPKYTATTQMLVHQKNASASSSGVNQQSDVQMINTYKDLIVSRTVLNQVTKQINRNSENKVTVGHLQKEISVTSKQNSQIFTVSVVNTNPHKATLIANTLTTIFIRRTKKIMNTNNITIVSNAVLPDKPSYPNIKVYTAGGAIIGLFLGFLSITFSYWIKEPDYINESTRNQRMDY